MPGMRTCSDTLTQYKRKQDTEKNSRNNELYVMSQQQNSAKMSSDFLFWAAAEDKLTNCIAL